MKLQRKTVVGLLRATLLTIKLVKTIEGSKREKKKRKPKRFWERAFLKQRKELGAFWTLIPQLLHPDPNETRPETYFNYFRMSPQNMDFLLEKVKPIIQKAIWVREPISPAERLAMTIRYLSSGDSMKSISFQYRIGYSTVSTIIKETTAAIWTALHDEYLPGNLSETDWRVKARDFEDKWNFPHCCGAFDGKHVNVQAFNNKGSAFFNYKGQHSIVLLALSDANYGFTAIDVGAEGRFSDGGLFRTWNFGKALCTNTELLNLPPPEQLPSSEKILPFVFVGDEAFPLLTNLMRPFPGRGSISRMPRDKAIFNYRLSRARRVVENSFGILCNRFRIFRRPIVASYDTVVNIVKATVVLHNFLVKMEQNYVSQALLDIDTQSIPNTGITAIPGSNVCNRPTNSGTSVRESFMDYFVNEGAVPWQNDHIFNVQET